MEAYLKGYYGYKNFGDELLLLGVINYIQENYKIESLVIETQDKVRLEHRLRQNNIFLGAIKVKLSYSELPASKPKKILFFLQKIFSKKYKSYYKFLGGGEVLSPERKTPHDGRNLYLGEQLRKQKEHYTLLGGIGLPQNKKTKKLYEKIIPFAEKIIVREADSYQVVLQYLPGDTKKKAILHEDFSKSILLQAEDLFRAHGEKKITEHRRYDVIKNGILTGTEELKTFFTTGYFMKLVKHQESPYILINLNKKSRNPENIEIIRSFTKKYPDAKKIFFPCDIQDDLKLFSLLRAEIPELELFDWTKHSLMESLHLFFAAQAGIGARLHFLYPLKIFAIPFEAIVYSDKVRKLILN